MVGFVRKEKRQYLCVTKYIRMKKRVIGLLLVVFVYSNFLYAGQQPIRVGANAGYGYNYTWSHYGWVDVAAFLPLNTYFEMDALAQLNIANVYTVSLDMRPKFPMKVGEIFLDTKLLYRAVVRNRIHDFTGGFSFGYRMDYVSVQIGIAGRLLEDMDVDWHTVNSIAFEPTMLYGLEVFVRPQQSKWNLSFAVANFDRYQMERFFQPMFMVNSRVDVNERIRLYAGVECKPTGMFHLDASFYGVHTYFGFAFAVGGKK